MVNTDKAWNHFGSAEPYYGVLTRSVFERGNLNDAAREAFFRTGDDYVDFIFSGINDHLNSGYAPHRALDFGCGVGRVTFPLARRVPEVVGVDISAGMLQEAAVNSARLQCENVELLSSDDKLSQVDGTFDLIHSFIVFQHITPTRGERIFKELLSRLRCDGIGVIHFTYANSRSTPQLRRIVTSIYERVPLTFKARNALKGVPLQTPQMHMNRYQLSRVFRLLQEFGCHDVHIQFTEASHYRYPIYGAILFFRKRPVDVGLYS